MIAVEAETAIKEFNPEMTPEEVASYGYLPFLAQRLWRGRKFRDWNAAFDNSDQDLLGRHGIGPKIIESLRKFQKAVHNLRDERGMGRPHLIELLPEDVTVGSKGRKLIFIDRCPFVFLDPEVNRTMEALFREQVSGPILGLEKAPVEDLEKAVSDLNRFDLDLEVQKDETRVRLMLPDHVKVRIIEFPINA